MLSHANDPQINIFVHPMQNQENLHFVNNKVQALYDSVNSYEVSQMNTAIDIYNALNVLIEAVINDPRAINEANAWPAFSTIIDHQNGIHSFQQMNLSVSRAFSLWMYIYH